MTFCHEAHRSTNSGSDGDDNGSDGGDNGSDGGDNGSVLMTGNYVNHLFSQLPFFHRFNTGIQFTYIQLFSSSSSERERERSRIEA